ncbi:hypothetical protein DE146DRAFT_679738 [Phaeosphaeria sp. MPI-PUGE-AT-0046c]|nr:hypothetical protein DE146DRAFT_679738 [Phaeosphaeria sp. MPI-PUGE-AT-0046c]
MAAEASWISVNDLLRTDYAMLALTSIIFVARIIIQVWRRKTIEWQDAWLYIAYTAFLTMCILYTHITPTFFKIEELGKGQIQYWDGMQSDIKLTTQVMFTSGVLFWTCLWCVKFSLLALYKKLLVGLSVAWVYTYWGIVAFCVLTYISCFATGPAIACDNPTALFNEGAMCFSSKEVRHQTASMYYAFAVDAVTNLMVMFLPLRLVMPLQMPRNRKIGVGILFCSGFVCILFSTIRIVQITSRNGPKSPDPKWLTMWTIIECSTAVIIGCCPMLAALIPKTENPSHRVSYDVNGYVRQSASRSGGSAPTGFKLESVKSSTKSSKKQNSVMRSSGTRASHDEENDMVRHDDERRNDPRNVRQLRRMR